MFVRGPGITGGTRASNVGGNVDLAPTFLDLAGVPIPPQVDGRSIAPLLRGELGAGGGATPVLALRRLDMPVSTRARP